MPFDSACWSANGVRHREPGVDPHPDGDRPELCEETADEIRAKSRGRSPAAAGRLPLPRLRLHEVDTPAVAAGVSRIAGGRAPEWKKAEHSSARTGRPPRSPGRDRAVLDDVAIRRPWREVRLRNDAEVPDGNDVDGVPALLLEFGDDLLSLWSDPCSAQARQYRVRLWASNWRAGAPREAELWGTARSGTTQASFPGEPRTSRIPRDIHTSSSSSGFRTIGRA